MKATVVPQPAEVAVAKRRRTRPKIAQETLAEALVAYTFWDNNPYGDQRHLFPPLTLPKAFAEHDDPNPREAKREKLSHGEIKPARTSTPEFKQYR